MRWNLPAFGKRSFSPSRETMWKHNAHTRAKPAQTDVAPRLPFGDPCTVFVPHVLA